MALSKNRIFSSVHENLLLFKACEQGDLRTLENALNSLSSSDIELIRDDQKATLVHHASRYGHLHILEYFIVKKHLDISQLRTEHGATCAHDAAVCDQVEILNYLFHYHQINNKSNKQDFTQKLRWTVRDDHGNSPLHLAAAYGSIRSLHFLLEYESADPHIRSYNGFQPIHYASSSGHTDCVKLLLSVAPNTVNEQTNALFTPLFLTCQYGSIETMKLLLSRGANLKLRDENGLNCLHAACQNSHFDIVQWLVERQNAIIDDVDYMNNTPLHYAAASGNEHIITYLLEKNARIIISSTGDTPLHVAAENGQQRACAVLIERASCSVLSRNSNQLTPIDLANRSKHLTLANELRLHINSSYSPSLTYSTENSSSKISQKIQLDNATIVRLVVKKRNVQRCDASNQVYENELIPNKQIIPTKKLINQRFDLSELRAKVEEHEAIRRDTMANGDQDSNVLLHSMDSINKLNPRRPKLPAQTYAPWLKMGNMTPEVFHQEIQKVGANLRKVRRDSLMKTNDRNSNSNSNDRRSRQSQSVGPSTKSLVNNGETSSSSSDTEFINNQNNNNNNQWKRTGFQTKPEPMPISKSHQFIISPSQSGLSLQRPEWQRDLIERRRAAANGNKTQS